MPEDDSAGVLPNLEFAAVGPFEGTLGWRFDEVVPRDALATIELAANEDFRSFCMSPRREVAVPRFEIAKTAFHSKKLIDVNEAWPESLDEFCQLVNERLSEAGLRLPTEDELEVACGGSLFPWGDVIPDGVPDQDETQFQGRRQPNQHGLLLNSNPYQCEAVSGYLKLGDGGEAIHGYAPWPIPWLSFCPAFRVDEWSLNDISELLEYLDATYLRPVKQGA